MCRSRAHRLREKGRVGLADRVARVEFLEELFAGDFSGTGRVRVVD